MDDQGIQFYFSLLGIYRVTHTRFIETVLRPTEFRELDLSIRGERRKVRRVTFVAAHVTVIDHPCRWVAFHERNVTGLMVNTRFLKPNG